MNKINLIKDRILRINSRRSTSRNSKRESIYSQENLMKIKIFLKSDINPLEELIKIFNKYISNNIYKINNSEDKKLCCGLLHKIPEFKTFFSEYKLEEEHLKDIFEFGRIMDLKKEQYLFYQGCPSNECFIFIKGELSLRLPIDFDLNEFKEENVINEFNLCYNNLYKHIKFNYEIKKNKNNDNDSDNENENIHFKDIIFANHKNLNFLKFLDIKKQKKSNVSKDKHKKNSFFRKNDIFSLFSLKDEFELYSINFPCIISNFNLLYGLKHSVNLYSKINDSIVICLDKNAFFNSLSKKILKVETNYKNFLKHKINTFSSLSLDIINNLSYNFLKIFPKLNEEITIKDIKSDYFYLVYKGNFINKNSYNNCPYISSGGLIGIESLFNKAYQNDIVCKEEGSIVFRFKINYFTHPLIIDMQKNFRIINEKEKEIKKNLFNLNKNYQNKLQINYRHIFTKQNENSFEITQKLINNYNLIEDRERINYSKIFNKRKFKQKSYINNTLLKKNKLNFKTIKTENKHHKKTFSNILQRPKTTKLNNKYSNINNLNNIIENYKSSRNKKFDFNKKYIFDYETDLFNNKIKKKKRILSNDNSNKKQRFYSSKFRNVESYNTENSSLFIIKSNSFEKYNNNKIIGCPLLYTTNTGDNNFCLSEKDLFNKNKYDYKTLNEKIDFNINSWKDTINNSTKNFKTKNFNLPLFSNYFKLK